MHTSNDLAKVTTELIPSKRLGGGASMLHIRAASNEGGVYQLFARDDHGPERVVASVWVYVTRGRVALGTGNEGATPNAALSTTRGKWEKLQACSDGTTTNNWFVIYSTDVEGSDFYVDLARVSKVKPIGNQCGGMVIERIVPNVTVPGGTIAINGRNFGNRQGTKNTGNQSGPRQSASGHSVDRHADPRTIPTRSRRGNIPVCSSIAITLTGPAAIPSRSL